MSVIYNKKIKLLYSVYFVNFLQKSNKKHGRFLSRAMFEKNYLNKKRSSRSLKPCFLSAFLSMRCLASTRFLITSGILSRWISVKLPQVGQTKPMTFIEVSPMTMQVSALRSSSVTRKVSPQGISSRKKPPTHCSSVVQLLICPVFSIMSFLHKVKC